MDTGFDKQQLEDLKRWLAALADHPERLRLWVCMTLLLVGWLGVVRPLSGRLAAAQDALKDGKLAAARAAEASHYVEQTAAYSALLSTQEDVDHWQAYVLQRLDAAGLGMRSIEPFNENPKWGFKLAGLEVVALAERYEQIVDFVARLEHGEQLVRIESLVIDEEDEGLLLQCTIRGLVRPGKAKKPAVADEAANPSGKAGEPG